MGVLTSMNDTTKTSVGKDLVKIQPAEQSHQRKRNKNNKNTECVVKQEVKKTPSNNVPVS